MEDRSLFNEDLAPIPLSRRSWGLYSYASLWVAMSVCIPTYMLASGLIAGGMNWWQAVGTILLGNLIVLAPMLLNAHAGTKYGIPFPVFVRASFGVRGANLPAVLRALVACGWFGIQTWIGGQAIHSMLEIVWPAAVQGWILWVCFSAFWLLNMVVIWKGIDTIRFLEGIGAPFMLGVGLLLLFWITRKAGGFGPVLSAPGKFQNAREFMRFFIPSLTAMVGFWATVALNIPDFTRYAKSQRDQALGQALGLPTAMTLYSFIGVAVTSASAALFGEPIWDPVILIGRFHQQLLALVALIAIVVATLNTNLAANVVSPSNDFSNLNPRLISFRTGGLITGVVGVLMMPWKLLSDFSAYIFGWLVGYSALLGPVAGIMIADYFLVRRTRLRVDDLYRRGGEYEYKNGVNPKALVSLGAGVAVALIGLASPALRFLYDYAWFVGFGVSAASYLGLKGRTTQEADEEPRLEPSKTEPLGEHFPPLTAQEALVEAHRCLFCYDAPCTRACPTHIDVPRFIKKISTDNLVGSARAIFDANLLGATCARVCPVQELCEGACVLGAEHKPIMIGRLQRYAMDHIYSRGLNVMRIGSPIDRKVAVVGCGPAGLSCAGELARRGYQVTAFERRELAGGLSTYGIISLREPVHASLEEVKMIERLGVSIETRCELGAEISLEDLRARCDAVFLGLGLGATPAMGIEGEEHVIDGLAYIEQSKMNGSAMRIGRSVAVIGAGNTAIDCATIARRLGAERVIMIYRRSAREMTAYAHEYEFIKKEGVEMRFLMQPTAVIVEDGQVVGLRAIRMELGPPEASGRRVAQPANGLEFTISTDQVVKATGQEKPSLAQRLGLALDRGYIKVAPNFETSIPGVFAGGDCIRAKNAASTVMAVQDGKLAAASIHAKLSETRNG